MADGTYVLRAGRAMHRAGPPALLASCVCPCGVPSLGAFLRPSLPSAAPRRCRSQPPPRWRALARATEGNSSDWGREWRAADWDWDGAQSGPAVGADGSTAARGQRAYATGKVDGGESRDDRDADRWERRGTDERSQPPQVSAELARLARLLRGGMVLAALFVEDTLLALTPLTVPRTAVRLVSRVLSLALGALLVWQFLNVLVLVAACALGVFFATRSLLDGRDASTATAATAAHHNDAYDDVIDHRSRAATFADDWWAGVHDPRRFGYGWWRTLRDAVEDAAVFDNTKTLWSWVDDSADWSEGATGRGNEGDGDSRRRRPEKDAARRDDFATATTRSNTWRDDEDGRAPATGTPGASGSYTYRGGGGGGGTSERWREEPDGPEPSQRARQPDPRRWEGRPRQRDRERPPYAGQRPRRRNADLLDVWWDNDGDAASPR